MTVAIRLRLRELLADKGMSWYALSRDSRGRISLSTAYRIKKGDGRGRFYDAEILDAICETLNVPASALLERVPGKSKRR